MSCAEIVILTTRRKVSRFQNERIFNEENLHVEMVDSSETYKPDSEDLNIVIGVLEADMSLIK
jgi:hypothetical protein